MSKSLSERDRMYIWHPYTQAKITPHPIPITRAFGSYLFTDTNKRLFDGISSWWTNSHGHCHSYIGDAIYRQAQTLEHVIFANLTHEPAVTLAERLLSVCPPGLNRVFYSDNGSTSVEIALKMAFQYWQHRKEDRPYFIALEHGYHGDTFGAMSISQRSVYTKPFWPLLFKVINAPSTCVSEISAKKSAADITDAALKEIANLLCEHKGQVSAIIIEPMLQGAHGMRVFTHGFLRGIKKLCLEYDCLLIADEVATGFFRTGRFFACEHEEVSPDIMCVAKGLTGGFLPLAATLSSEKIYEAFLSDSKADALLHGHSFTANPLGCAAAIASLDLFQQDETKQRIHDICETISNGIEEFRKISLIKNARSIGTIAIIELLAEETGYLSRSTERIYNYCFEKGLYIRPLGNVIYLMPPFSATKEEITWALSTIREAIIAN